MKIRFARVLFLVIVGMLLGACDSGGGATPTAATTATVAVPTATAVAAVVDTATVVSVSTSTGVATEAPSATAATSSGGATPAATASAASGQAVVTAVPSSSAPAQDTAVVAQPTVASDQLPSPTAVSATATGNAVTALSALRQMAPKALAWKPDARLVMLANVRPGQADKLLGIALGDPNVNQPTPGGLGRNWAVIVFSPSTKGSVAIEMDGKQTDLVQEGALTSDMVQRFGSADMAALDLSKLDLTKLADSDATTAKIGSGGQGNSAMSIAMLAPNGLGLGPLPTPASGGSSPELAYELFSVDPSQQRFVFFDAATGSVVMDSAGP